MANRSAWESMGRWVPPGALAPYTVSMEVDVDFIEKQSHTQGFMVPELVVTRRGTKFPVTLKTRSRLTIESAALVYDEDNRVNLTVGSQNSRVYGTVLELSIPVATPVTLYTLTVTGKFEDQQSFTVTLTQQVVVLFNAWSRQDEVFLEDEDSRQEYVLESNGRVYAGDRYGMAWNLALYRPNSLRATLFLLESYAKLTFKEKSSPILVSREMSALVNVQDDNGVLVGRWDGDYSGGQSPGFWRGSGQILEQFYRSKGEPVRYGQCWVFSGVLLTVLRILGLPSRSVTNFNSAHDTNRNRTIDEYYDENGDAVSYLTSGGDSIWNFHVWNEAWMSRPDLPPGFEGWQIVDATPQEESPQGGGYRTGPAPLKAVKEGNSVPFDTNFVIAEVNADIKKFTVGSDGAPRLFEVDTKTVGQGISTKTVGSWRREDITHLYKYPEGSDWERRALYEGYEELMKETHDVQFEVLEATYDFGQNVAFEVKATNKGRQHRIKGKITCKAASYTGRVLREVVTEKVDIKVNKGKTDTVQVNVEGTIFSEFPGTKVFLKFEVYLAVHGTSQIFSRTVPVSPLPPELKLTAPDEVILGVETEAVVTFKNPLPFEMNETTLNIESDQLLPEDIIVNVGTIEAGAEFSYGFKITGEKLGKFNLVVGLDSNKTEMVTGEKEVKVVRPKEPQPPPVVPMETLAITGVDMHIKKNSEKHHTSRYVSPNLVVRRGESFMVTVTTAEPIPKGTKVVTRAVFQQSADMVRYRNSFEVVALSEAKGTRVDLELKAPADASVGEYDLVLTMDKDGRVTVIHDRIKLVVLFNPWCPEDSCHYPDTSELDEYVLNNQGRIWVGSAYSNYGRPWQFAQFQKESFEASLWILNKLSYMQRGDPIQVVRHVSAWINVQDEDGLLVGNWSGKYDGGTPPSDWNGSGEILAEFNKTKEPVRYGQCWVFSGLQTTVLRCLGLATRSVTNFDSAHDTNFNRAIDKYYDESGESITSGDSIWNFHVWNEAWMSRSDLPTGFGGWQVLDSTPQEESPQGGGYRLGPCSRRAVKLGQRMNYDVEFVISEVNADVRYYTVHEDGTQSLTHVNTSHVGKYISTKAIGSSKRNDITLDYKYPERSLSERAVLLAETESEKSIGLELSVDDDVLIGQDFFVRVIVTNKTDTTREFAVRMHGKAVLYTGAPGQRVKSLDEFIILDPSQSKTVEMWVEDIDYLRILEGGNFINFVAMVIHRADKLSVVKTTNFRFKTPDIVITLPEGGLKLYQPASIKVSFTNPLGQRLSRGQFRLMGEGHIQDVSADVPSVGPYGEVSAVMETIPVQSGDFTLIARFNSNQLTDILGDEDVSIE